MDFLARFAIPSYHPQPGRHPAGLSGKHFFTDNVAGELMLLFGTDFIAARFGLAIRYAF